MGWHGVEWSGTFVFHRIVYTHYHLKLDYYFRFHVLALYCEIYVFC